MLNKKKKRLSKKSFFTLCKKAIRKFLSQTIAPLCPFNALRICIYRICGFKIGNNVFIGMKCYLDDSYYNLICIEDDCCISYGVYFACHGWNHLPAPIKIEKGAYIGMRSSIISKNASGEKGVIIGKKAIVGACTLVNRNIPEGATACGIPCRVIKYSKTSN